MERPPTLLGQQSPHCTEHMQSLVILKMHPKKVMQAIDNNGETPNSHHHHTVQTCNPVMLDTFITTAQTFGQVF